MSRNPMIAIISMLGVLVLFGCAAPQLPAPDRDGGIGGTGQLAE